MNKRIWFKKDCIQWILEGKKTTTFRSQMHFDEYEIVEGSRFKSRGLGIILELIPRKLPMRSVDLIEFHYHTEGDFDADWKFQLWLEGNKLSLPKWGYLHDIKILENPMWEHVHGNIYTR